MYKRQLVFGALIALGEGIVKLGGVGAGLYAFFNRLLIPTGLHHALNNVFWFDTIGLGEMCIRDSLYGMLFPKGNKKDTNVIYNKKSSYKVTSNNKKVTDISIETESKDKKESIVMYLSLIHIYRRNNNIGRWTWTASVKHIVKI